MSSYRGRAAASVRQPGGHIGTTGDWALTELAADVPAAPAFDDAMFREGLATEYRRGFADGEAAGIAKGEARARATMEPRFAACREVAEAAARELESVKSGMLSGVEQNVAALAVLIAKQIIEREVGSEPELIASLVRRALTEFPVDQAVRIRVHPLDLSSLTARGAEGAPLAISGTRDVTWVADPRVSRGGCLVAGADRIVDGRVDTALERAYRRMAVVDAT
jgi:flagellar assembly protein FliH